MEHFLLKSKGYLIFKQKEETNKMQKLYLLLFLLITLTLNAAITNKDITLKDGKALKLNEPTNTYSTSIKSSNVLAQDLMLTMPSSLPMDGQILVVNSSGELSWSDANLTGSSGDDNQIVDKFILDGNQILLS